MREAVYNKIHRGLNDKDHIQQPKESSLCGQACVAMLRNISLQDSAKGIFKSNGGTSTRQVCKALGLSYRRLRPIRNNLSNLPTNNTICKVCWNNSNQSHWIVINTARNLVLDPCLDKATNFNWYVETYLPLKGKITSYLSLEKEIREVQGVMVVEKSIPIPSRKGSIRYFAKA